MVRSAYPKLNVISVHDVEDAVVDSKDNALGLEIVQSGSTLREKGLFLFGEPLFLSESLYVANYYTYIQKKSELKKVISSLKPIGYYEDERVNELAKWFYALELNLGENWINRPTDITTLLVNNLEIEEGLRPYRVETRYWSPSDNYKLEEAYKTIERAKEKLILNYKKIKEAR
jgi:ubiquitin